MKKHLYTIIGMLLLLLSNTPAFAAEELVPGISNEWVLIGLLSGGVFILFSCILALAFMLYKAVPMLVARNKSGQS
jgi:hypothetical protein